MMMANLKIMALLGFSALAQAQMDPLDNDQLEDVVAQQGVAISLDWRLNVDKAGNKLALCTDTTTYKECRIGWAFNNRGDDDAGGKRWLVLKGFTGSLYIPYLRVDASSVTYTTDAAASKTVPAVLLSFGDVATASGANTKVQIKNLTIDNLAFESDTGVRRGYFADSTCEPAGSGPAGAGCAGFGPTIPTNVNTGFMGLQINGPSNVANLQIDGTIKLFPCVGDHQSC